MRCSGPLSTSESTNNGQVSLRTGPQSNGRRWPCLIYHVLITSWMAGCWMEAVWCFGRCFAGKPWVLPSMWMLLWCVPLILALLQTVNCLSWKWYFLIAVASSNRITRVPQSKNGSGMGLGARQRVGVFNLASKFPRAFVGCVGQTSQIHGDPTTYRI